MHINNRKYYQNNNNYNNFCNYICRKATSNTQIIIMNSFNNKGDFDEPT